MRLTYSRDCHNCQLRRYQSKWHSTDFTGRIQYHTGRYIQWVGRLLDQFEAISIMDFQYPLLWIPCSRSHCHQYDSDRVQLHVCYQYNLVQVLTVSDVTSYDNGAHESPKIGVIVGPAVGGSVGLILLFIVVYMLLRPRQRQSRKDQANLFNENGMSSAEMDKVTSGTGCSSFLPYTHKCIRTDNSFTATIPYLPNVVTRPEAPGLPIPEIPNDSGSDFQVVAPHPLLQSLAPQLLDRKDNPFTSSSTPPSQRRLTQHQVDLVQRLSEQNIPGPALSAVIESMLSGV